MALNDTKTSAATELADGNSSAATEHTEEQCCYRAQLADERPWKQPPKAPQGPLAIEDVPHKSPFKSPSIVEVDPWLDPQYWTAQVADGRNIDPKSNWRAKVSDGRQIGPKMKGKPAWAVAVENHAKQVGGVPVIANKAVSLIAFAQSANEQYPELAQPKPKGPPPPPQLQPRQGQPKPKAHVQPPAPPMPKPDPPKLAAKPAPPKLSTTAAEAAVKSKATATTTEVIWWRGHLKLVV